MQAYSQDLRDRVLRALERGDGPSAIAERYEVSRRYVYDVKERLEREGERSTHRIGGHRVSKLAAWEETIRAWITEEPDLTLEELGLRLQERASIKVCPATIWHQLNRWGLSFKKNAARQRARAARRGAGAL